MIQESDYLSLSRTERRREDTRSEIRERAWALLASEGREGLSLRRIATEMGLSSPALYRYVPDRASLVAELGDEALASFGAAQRAALLPDGSGRGPFARLCAAWRSWALERPEAFALAFLEARPRAPVAAGSAAAAEAALHPLLAVLEGARAAGRLRLPLEPGPPPSLQAGLAAWSGRLRGMDGELLCAGLALSARLVGLIAAELLGRLPAELADPGELYAHEAARAAAEYLESDED